MIKLLFRINQINKMKILLKNVTFLLYFRRSIKVLNFIARLICFIYSTTKSRCMAYFFFIMNRWCLLYLNFLLHILLVFFLLRISQKIQFTKSVLSSQFIFKCIRTSVRSWLILNFFGFFGFLSAFFLISYFSFCRIFCWLQCSVYFTIFNISSIFNFLWRFTSQFLFF
ncbi:transmembrane protein, putative (macronuclear) [Tetrahymena thermophila SB210]|uniref:Transmembrane protein, putative n=1 Tax=Tetrahymena thermophila (strain SB210) TaxID=312017 RepID=W7XJX8_TETTS|nr:transmembrane protein, putative [Tetrahymena thermophila SB210]EWS74419.1 transmembrane protein, putative [Tetrahymena thermophila SB210]|eukprot:XP_012652996.1 transmembrane protein, putative [Tetrahymena thermophila SB210]